MEQEFIKRVRVLLPEWWAPQGALEDQLSRLESEAGVRLPKEYVEFMRMVDGYAGQVGGKGYVDIMTIDEAIRTNSAHKIRETMHGLLLFASDGGGEAFAFDLRGDEVTVVQVPWVGMDWECANKVGTSFMDFLEQLAQQKG